MIFYKAIKYRILEYCLNLLFDTFRINTISLRNRLDISEIRPKMEFSKIVFHQMEFSDCIIISSTTYDSGHSYIVRFYHKASIVGFNVTSFRVYRTSSVEFII